MSVKRHIVWVCAGCDRCAPLDGSDPERMPCTDTSPSMDGAEVVRAEDYDALAGERDRYRKALARIADAESGHWGWIAHEALHPKQQHDTSEMRQEDHRG